MNRKAFWVGFAATIAAIGTHTYLAMTHFGVQFGAESHPSICQVGEAFDCSAVAASKYAEFMGVPMAIWGMVANAVLLLFALAFYFSDDKSRSNSRKNVLIVAGGIAAASIVMGSIATLLIGKYCLFCMIAYALSFISFVGFYLATKDSSKRTSSPLTSPRYDLKPLVFAIAGAAITALIINYGWKKSYGAQNLDLIVKSSVDEWAQTAPIEIVPIAPIAMGAEAGKAKMTIIEFADFLCPHCKAAGPTLHAFTNARKDVRYVFQTWPLDGECNSKINAATGLRCGLARFAYCASKLAPEKGFAAVDWIFDQQENFHADSRDLLEPTVTEGSKALGLDAQAAIACVNSDEAKEKIKQQADLGGRLNLEGTPTIFVNGKRLPAGQVLPVLKETYNRLD